MPVRLPRSSLVRRPVNGAEGISDIEGKVVKGSGERADKRSEFQIRVAATDDSDFLGKTLPEEFRK